MGSEQPLRHGMLHLGSMLLSGKADESMGGERIHRLSPIEPEIEPLAGRNLRDLAHHGFGPRTIFALQLLPDRARLLRSSGIELIRLELDFYLVTPRHRSQRTTEPLLTYITPRTNDVRIDLDFHF